MDSTKILNTFNTIKEMLIDRNIDISNLENISQKEIEIQLNSNNNEIFYFNVNSNMKIVYYLSKNFKIATLENYLLNLNKKNNIKNFFIVIRDKINNLNFKSIKNINIQFFIIKELLFNITKHILVPKHEVIRDSSEINDLVSKHNLKNKLQFPLILKTDPMAKYLNVQSGELVKITRISPSSGEIIIYRCCI